MCPATCSLKLVGVVLPMPTLPELFTNKASVLPALILSGETVELAPVCKLSREPVPLLLALSGIQNRLSLPLPFAQLKTSGISSRD
jgi:hypothetical protein